MPESFQIKGSSFSRERRLQEKVEKENKDQTPKKSFKKQIVLLRKSESALVNIDSETIPIHFLDESEFIHYPLTEEDVREFLKRLPDGILNCLSCIEMKFGYGMEKQYTDSLEPDPYTGRPGFEFLPGVFQPKVLGNYVKTEKKIEVFAYVYKDMPDFEQWHVFLKIFMLRTLSQQLVHHHDFQQKMSWTTAEKTEPQAIGRFVLPWVEENYPEEIEALKAWILNNVGVQLPLALLVGDPGRTMLEYSAQACFEIIDYFGDFVKDIYEDIDIYEARLNLAQDLNSSAMYGLALSVAESILVADPKNLKALNFKTAMLIYMERLEEAEQSARAVLAINRNLYEPWFYLSRISFEKADWIKTIEFSKKALELVFENADRIILMIRLAKARIEMGDLNGAEETLEAISNTNIEIVNKRIFVLREEIGAKRD